LPATVARHETVALPEPPMLGGVTAPHVRPVGTISARVTFPAKPFSAPIVTVEFAKTPALTGPGDVALIVKSVTVKIAVARRDAFPGEPLPEIVTVKVPATVEEHDNLEEAVAFLASVTGEGLKTLHERPVGTVSVSAIDPAKF
jgi:hypothetical protein